VWDFPLRLFHWGLLVNIVGAIISAKAEVLWVHERFGLTVLGLIIFRIVWGFLGGHYARFSQFLAMPRVAFQELKTLFRPTLKPCSKLNMGIKAGHSALGGYAVLGLLGIPLFMAISGTMSNDDVLFDGPLAHLVPNGSDKATSAHHIGEKLLYIILCLHISAILFYKFKKKRNLTKAMVTGKVDDRLVSAGDGGISANRNYFGCFLMLVFIAAAQSITLLRPSLF
jgi:cytochrome b